MSSKYVISSFAWSTSAKLFDALVKFISVPLLLDFFGKSNFGLISLAISVNAYLQLLDMGVNTGAIKFFSEWISQKKFNLLDSAARTSISFYAIIGILNTVVLIWVSFYGMTIFSIDIQQALALKNLFLILAGFTVINWSTSVFNQLIIANHNIKFIQKINILRSFLNLLIIIITLKFDLNLELYFFLFCVANCFMIFPYYLECKKSGLIFGFMPRGDWHNFNVIFKYSLAIIAMGIFQMSATKLRPILLGIYSSNASDVLAEFRIMETITIFIISIGGMFINILLPMTSKLLLDNDKNSISKFAYKTTLFTSVACSILCFPFVVGGREILLIYVGKEYADLYPWLVIWVMTILFYLHNTPVATLILASGKTKMLVVSSAIACVLSLLINVILIPYYEVGSAIIGYGVYIVIQMSFYYFYFNNKVLDISSIRVFTSFIKPVSVGIFMTLIVFSIDFDFSDIYLALLVKEFAWLFGFLVFLFMFKILDDKVIKAEIGNIINK
ncbi:polysaccharide biosynthesis C-terminal domain-containing protein [uncultured Algoriphagus sp.]|uniref:lipopolysaccharide biosynthesis protein n=1 Tax=uncultured Algoriphagus sp. TaxID=417365 RepID=UPI0030EE1864|tara:strand:+ start:23503 stop:25005 length:1503 start_codon:yes stop_codon:yes gene_type:complete